MSTNIQVCIKIRPPISREVVDNCNNCLWYVENTSIVQKDENGRFVGDIFSFDHIFNESQTNSDAYNSVVRSLVQSSIEGFNSTVFAYGQTSSGKTYTMLGDDNVKTRGIMHLAIDDLFDHINKDTNRKYLTRCSYIEIYNEKINDLLDKNGKYLKIREDLKGVRLNVKEEMVNESNEVFHLMKLGNKIRKIGCTDMNERSSRSHTIFKIIIQSTENGSEGSYKESHLNFVDLAGSERVGHMQLTGERHLEGVHINKSLTTLGMVIRKLSENEAFINYRDSKLTRLLQSALGGNSKTLVIAAITLAASEETKSTLEFARRAKAVKNKPTINQMVTDKDQMKEYERMLKKYEDNLKALEVDRENKSRTIEQLQNKMKRISVFMPLAFKTRTSQIAYPTPMRRHTLAYELPRGPISFSAELPILSEDEEFDEILEPASELDFPTSPRCSGMSDYSEDEEPSDSQFDKETQTSFMELVENDPNWNFLDNISAGNTTLQPENASRRVSGNQSISNDTLWEKTFSDVEERDNTFEFKELREHNLKLQCQLIQLIAELKDLKEEKEKDFEETNLLVREARKDKQLICAKYEDEIADLRQSLKKLAEEKSSLGFSLEQALGEKNKLETKLANLQNDSDFMLNNTTQNFNKKIKRLTEEIEKLHNITANVSLCQTIVKDDSEKVIELERDLEESKQSCKKHQEENEKLHQRCEDLKEENKILERENSKLKNAEMHMTKLTEEMKNVQVKLEIETSKYKENLEQAKQQDHETQERLKREVEQNTMLIENCKNVKDEKDKLNIEYKILNEENNILHQKYDSLTEAFKILEQEKDTALKNCEKISKSLETVELKCNNLQTNLEKLKQEGSEYQKKIVIETKEKIMVISKFETLKHENEDLNLKYETLCNENKMLNNKCEDLILERTNISLKHDTDKDIINDLNNKYEFSKTETQKLHLECENLRKEKEDLSILLGNIVKEKEALLIKYDNIKHNKENISVDRKEACTLKRLSKDRGLLQEKHEWSSEPPSNRVSTDITENEEFNSKLLIENKQLLEENHQLLAKLNTSYNELSKLKLETEALSEEKDCLIEEYDQKMFDQIDKYEELRNNMLKKDKEVLNSLLSVKEILLNDLAYADDERNTKEDKIIRSIRRLSIEVCKIIESEKDTKLAKLESQVVNTNKDIAELTDLYRDAKVKVEETTQELFNMNREKDELNRLFGLARKEADDVRQEMTDLRQKYETLQQEKVIELESELSSSKQEKQEFNEKNLKLSSRLDAANREITNLTKRTVILEGLINNSNREKEEFKRLLEINEKELKHLRQKYEKLRQDKVIELESLIKEKKECNEKNLELSSRLDAANREITNVTKKNVTLEGLINNSNKEKEEFKSLLDVNEKELEHLRQKYETLQQEKVIELESELGSSKQEKQEFNEKNLVLSSRLDAANREITNLTKRTVILEGLINNSNREKEEFKRLLEINETELKHLRQKYEKLRQDKVIELESLIKEKQECNEKNLELSSRLDAANREITNVTKKNVTLEGLINNSNKEKEEFKSLLDINEKELKQFNSEKADSLKNIKDLQEKISKLDSDFTTTTTENVKLNEKYQILKDENDAAVKTNDHLKRTISELNHQLVVLTAENKELKIMNQAYKNQKDQAKTSFILEDGSEIAKLRAELNSLKTENKLLDDQCNEFFEHIQKQDHIYSEPKARIEQLQIQLKELQDRLEKSASLEETLKELQTEIQRMQKVIKGRDVEIVRLTTRKFDLKRHYIEKVEQYEDEIKRLSSKSCHQHIEKKECGLQVDIINYDKLMERYAIVKDIAQRRNAEILKLKKMLNIEPDAENLNLV